MNSSFVQYNIIGTVVLFLLLFRLGYTTGRRHCYSCSTLEIGSTCLHIPANVTEGWLTVPCKYYCTIWRQQYLYSPEYFGHFVVNRSCEERPVHLNRIEIDDYFITHYRSCRGHLCNSGDGQERIPIAPGEEDEDNMEDGALRLSASFVITVLCVLKSLYLTRPSPSYSLLFLLES